MINFVINYTIHNGKDGSSNNVDNTLSYTYTPTGTWDMGKKNVYNITFTLTEIMIDPEVVDWEDDGWICTNVDSECYGEYTMYHFKCDEFEERAGK